MAAPLVLVGTVESVSDSTLPAGEFRLQPEAYLKGAAQSGALRFERAAPMMPCDRAPIGNGERVLIISQDGSEPFDWPSSERTFYLRAGSAVSANPSETAHRSEDGLVTLLRSATGQYVVPATSTGESAGIDWGTTVLPVGGALLAVFAIGLVLMRQWHKIDPS